MRHALALGVLVSLSWIIGCGTTLRSAGSDPAVLRMQPADEIRALWVDTWGEGIYTEAQIDVLVDYAVASGFNTLLVEVRKSADAYYESAYEPRGKDETTGRAITDFDPLKAVIARARRVKNLRVEAWVVANRVWKGPDLPGPMTPAHIANVWPQWVLSKEDGSKFEGAEGGERSVFVDPSDPVVRDYLVKIVADIVKNYDVDGIHLDYIRYPGNAWGYNPGSLARFADATHREDRPTPTDPEFTQWRAAQVTEEVRAVRERVRNLKPRVQLTAAVVDWGRYPAGGVRESRAYLDAMQDWGHWLDEGLLDVAYVMHYRREKDIEQSADFRMWFKEFQARRVPGVTRVVVGVGAYLNEIPGTMKQIKDALGAQLDGVAVFSYRTPNAGEPAHSAFSEALRAGPFR